MEFTTIDECQNKINNMKKLLYNFEIQADIQFPISVGEDYNNRFHHSVVNDIQWSLRCLEEYIVKLQEELDRYKNTIGVLEQDAPNIKEEERMFR